MTPINILATASARGLDIVAISDHNAIGNVSVAIKIGEMLGITVVPAMELQTNEDVHLLCLFSDHVSLEKFYNTLPFFEYKNEPEIYGEQLLFDDDDNIIGRESRLLLTACNISEYEVAENIAEYGGIAVPAHVDRESYGIRSVLGTIPDYYSAIEISCDNEKQQLDGELMRYNIIYDSDSHTLNDIGKRRSYIDLTAPTGEELIKRLKEMPFFEKKYKKNV